MGPLDNRNYRRSLPKRHVTDLPLAHRADGEDRQTNAGDGEDRHESGMSNRPARISQAEIERAIRAARKAGASEVEVKMGDGVSIRIPLAPDRPVAESEEIVL